ncbi:hypothetical protein GN109_12400 [Collimonas pratensis]|uniref:hypothetical protein n=1 Tax=Collimonas pratensis TaxID=279113 RepID=UPI00143DBC41|nr:hypothetical protein [Collimonas pratensis]NKI70223.1 hypothetical protein [Collimonas pratensis]
MLQTPILKKSSRYLLALLLLSHTAPAFCDGQFYVIWRDIGLSDAVRLVSQYSGRTIHLDQEVHATISLASAAPLSSNEIFTLFQKTLQERGLILVRIDDNGYQVKTAESDPINTTVVSNVISHQAVLRTSETATVEPAKNMPPSEELSGKQEEMLPSVSTSQNYEGTAESKPRFNDQTTKADSAALQSTVVKHRHVGAIFASEQRAQSIASRLREAGAEAEVVGPSNPADNDYSIVLSYRDGTGSYQALIFAIQRAGLDNLISTPVLSVAAPAQGK